MTEVLVVVGVFVFFISVYGAVMVGGHLLEELELAESTPTATSVDRRVEVAFPGESLPTDGQPADTPEHV